MSTLRLCATVAVLFFVGFIGGKWLLTELQMQPLQPDPRVPTFHHVDPDSARMKLEQSSESDDDPTRDRLRNEVLDYAKAFADDPCNQVLKTNYIKAVVAYVRAWQSIAPCLAIRSCTSWDSAKLDLASKAFGSPLDHRVRDAMQAAHAKATFGTGDFPKDTARMVADLAADDSLNSAPETKQFRQVSVQLRGTSERQDCGH
jgi:hypothetical protein